MHRTIATLGVAAAVAFAAAPAEAQTTLRIASWAPPSHHINADVLPQWGKWVEEESQGRLRTTIEYNLAPPPALPDFIADGGADMSWIFHGYNPGRYQLQQIVELPGLGVGAEAASVAYERVFRKHLEKVSEHPGLVVLAMHAHGQGVLHSREPVTRIDQFRGMKIRVPGGIGTEIVRLLGGQGVGVPAPQVYETLAQGVADGVVMPHETKVSFKLYEVAPNTFEVPGGMYYGSFAFIMNPDRLRRLSEQDREAVLRSSGERLSQFAGKHWEAGDIAALEFYKERNLSYTVADEKQTDEFFRTVSVIEENWIKAANDKGVDGRAAVDDMRAIAKAYTPAN